MDHNKLFKEYPSILLTIFSTFLGSFNHSVYYIIGICTTGVWFVTNLAIMALLVYVCWRINDKFVDEEGTTILYQLVITTVIPFGIGSYFAIILI